MDSIPRAATVTNTRGHPSEFQQLLIEKSENFVGRQFVFAAISEFLHRCDRGYFTLIGAPGSGKSAIFAKYVTDNPSVVYYSAQIEGKNRAEQFLTTICTQLMGSREWGVGSGDAVVPDNATEGSWFLSLLLQKISDQLECDRKLIIAIDALDAIDRNSQSLSSNLFYLPRYLPESVYFLLTRRPFLREKSGLLIETPSQILDLGEYPEQNREDVQAFIRNYLTPQTPLTPLAKGGTGMEESVSCCSSSSFISPPLLRGAGGDREGLGERSNLKSWLTTHNISEQEFSDRLTTQSENNFMYLSQILPAIAEGFYSEAFQFEQLPPSLEAYYQTHWQRMQGERLSAVELGVLHCLVDPPLPPLKKGGEREEEKGGISAEAIAIMIDEDEYEVEQVLENWIEFLLRQPIDGEIRYSLYHSSFRQWLGKQL